MLWTKCADDLRANNPDMRNALCVELWMDFRQLQRARVPEVTREQSAQLFEVWLLRHTARLQARIDANMKKLWDTIDHASINPPSAPFRCVCGTTTDNPADPDFMRVHVPHVQAIQRRSVRR